jgi:hypothetical protein
MQQFHVLTAHCSVSHTDLRTPTPLNKPVPRFQADVEDQEAVFNTSNTFFCR